MSRWTDKQVGRHLLYVGTVNNLRNLSRSDPPFDGDRVRRTYGKSYGGDRVGKTVWGVR